MEEYSLQNTNAETQHTFKIIAADYLSVITPNDWFECLQTDSFAQL